MDRFLQDIAQACQPAKPAPVRRPAAPRWLAPPPDCTKINVDAAVAKSAGLGSVAAIARDAVARFIGASAVTSHGIADPATLETLACREALALATDIGARRVMVGSDCLEAVLAINGRSLGPTSKSRERSNLYLSLFLLAFFDMRVGAPIRMLTS